MASNVSNVLTAAKSALSDANKKFPSAPKPAPKPATSAAPVAHTPTQGEELSKELDVKKKAIDEYNNAAYSDAKKAQ